MKLRIEVKELMELCKRAGLPVSSISNPSKDVLAVKPGPLPIEIPLKFSVRSDGEGVVVEEAPMKGPLSGVLKALGGNTLARFVPDADFIVKDGSKIALVPPPKLKDALNPAVKSLSIENGVAELELVLKDK